MGGRRAGNLGRVGPYTLCERLGRGGMGEVYLARDRRGRRVAIKLLRSTIEDDPAARMRLDREVRALRRVESPYVATVLDADLAGDRPYLVMEYIEGDTLLETVRRDGPLGDAELLALAHGLASALAVIHAAGVVHRDLKPANVILSARGPVLIDFGIAHVVDATRVTDTGVFLGTPGYAAPELFAGEPVGEAADLHAWGATVAFAATGRPTFGRGSAEAQMYAILHGQADLAGVPAALLPHIRAALHREPDKRPAAALLASRLDRLIRASAPQARPVRGRRRPAQIARARRAGVRAADAAPHAEAASPPDGPRAAEGALEGVRAAGAREGAPRDAEPVREPGMRDAAAREPGGPRAAERMRLRRRTGPPPGEVAAEPPPLDAERSAGGVAALFLLALLAVPGVAVSVVWAPATFLVTAAFGVLARALWSGHALVRGRRPGWGRALLRLVTFPVMLAVSLVTAVVWPGLVAGASAALSLWLASGLREPQDWWSLPGPITLAGVVFGIVCGGIFDREVDRAGMRMPELRRDVLRALALLGGFVAICAAAVRAVVVFL
ncbi:MAG: serine/threonine-protein kinase [Actinomycetes bacterium]